MMNILMQQDIFTLGTKISSQTQGFDAVVWVSEDSSKPAYIMVDTPGTESIDFKEAEQVAYFGAAYLVSSKMIYNTLRQVGSHAKVDFLAQRLRWVLSVNATLPQDAILLPNTSPVDVIWVVQNADFSEDVDAAVTKSQIQQYINEFSRDKFDLTEIFPNGIQPYVLPSPGETVLNERMSVMTEQNIWSKKYLNELEKVKAVVFDVTSGLEGMRPRVWPNFKTWRKRVEFAFSAEVSNTLKDIERKREINMQEAIRNAMTQNAKSYGRAEYEKQTGSLELDYIANYELTLKNFINASLDQVKVGCNM